MDDVVAEVSKLTALHQLVERVDVAHILQEACGTDVSDRCP